MSSKELDLCYTTVLNLVKVAGKIIKEKTAGRDKNIQTKTSRTDLVTETDTEIEKLLITTLSQHFPNHKFIGEESVASGGEWTLTDAPTWIIDPIDGTMNFVHSFPHSCISIALFINQQPVIGIVYNPVLEQLFTARKGQGAFLNGQQIKVSETTLLSDSLVINENLSRKENSYKEKVSIENYRMLMRETHGIRELGSAALNLCMIACGAADIYFQNGLNIWDIAAGELIITEAGGVVLDTTGDAIDYTSKRVLAANSVELARSLAQKIIQYDYKTDQ